MNISVLELFNLGGPVMYLLFATSVIALAIIIERVVVFMQQRQDFNAVIRNLDNFINKERDWEEAGRYCKRSRGPFTRLAAVYMRKRSQPKEVRDDLLRKEGLEITSELDEHLRWLAMISQIATLLGLLGTFHVMIMRLYHGQMAGNVTTNFVGAVWEALLTTMYGLLIAIPCSAVYQILEGRVDRTARQIEILVSYLDEWHNDTKSE